MIKKIVLILMIVIFIMPVFTVKASKGTDDLYKINMKQDLLVLMLAYPEYICSIKKIDDDHVYIIMKSSRKILYDDKKEKSSEGKLNNPDLQDMLEQKYPIGPVNKLMDKNFDPGRARVYELIKEVYGSSKSAIEKNLINVNTRYGTFRFNSKNNAATELKAAISELIPAADKSSKVKAALLPSSGTFNYRLIAGTSRLSPHSFGTAIDLARDKRDYWQWASREQGEKRLISYPTEVAETFEKHNFVWGGKWGHFDILHFEYRPEIILKAKYFGNKSNTLERWYEGAPVEEDKVKKCVELIDKVL